jgi:hypothetical protein
MFRGRHARPLQPRIGQEQVKFGQLDVPPGECLYIGGQFPRHEERLARKRPGGRTSLAGRLGSIGRFPPRLKHLRRQQPASSRRHEQHAGTSVQAKPVG